MGASQSQDLEPKLELNSVEPKNRENNIPVRPLTEKTTDPKPVIDPKSSKKTEKIQLPYNYEAILKDADSSVRMSGMGNVLHQLHSRVLNQKRKAIAELVRVCWVELVGKFNVSKLSPGTMYQVVFIVMLREEAYGWEVPVNKKSNARRH
ncbi:hypothetical protein F3Y22_tig00117022pilonHSYRG00068 [Hibiscus syriacus]|uniref:Uncharacterized protein n=1 Tax=Hibiscus syriacus TaxID=106335 RepID=A0A6A2WC14_HIBSY|nr:hypothetical protein F3Y22_tig00117022pilonHSYRG00068 [Hibiscus syriacus]